MKVLHVIPSLSMAHGGPSRALVLMEQALLGEGVIVHTATTNDDGPGRRHGKPLGVPLQEDGVTRWYFGKTMEFYKVSPAFARWIFREAAGYDLIHIHALFSFTSTAAAAAARRCGVPYVIRPLGTLNTYGMMRRRPRLKGWSAHFIEAPMLRHAAAVHFTSDDEAVQARLLGVSMKEAVIPLGIPASPQGAAPPRTKPGAAPQLLFLSRLDPKKNVEGLLSAIALLKHELPALRLAIAGDGSPAYVSGLKARAASLHLEQQVTWLGHVQGEHKIAAFAAADMFVLPSYSENFGIAAAEALAAGLPCVLGEGVAIAKEVLDADAGIMVGTDPASIAHGLRRIIAEHELLSRMSVNASQLARERYSAKAMGARLKRLYAEILNR
jgi:glycosyltransferase involved in cell wall biosynthesis